MIRTTLLFLFLAQVAAADALLANRAIPSRSVITALDIRPSEHSVPGAYTDPAEVIGMEARVTIYPGRPIRRGDLMAPAVVERNQIVSLQYATNGLFIETEGRALGRAGIGDLIRVMNLNSRTTVTGRVGPSGIVEVGK